MYSVSILPSAVRDLKRLPHNIQEKIRDQIDKLAKNPRPSGAKALKNGDGRLRIRIGDYRVIYKIEDNVLVVLIITVGHRKDVYRNL